MKQIPVVGKHFSEIAVISPSNEVRHEILPDYMLCTQDKSSDSP